MRILSNYLVHSLDPALGRPPLHKRDDRRRPALGVCWVGIGHSDEALGVLGEVFPVLLLDAARVEAILPSTVEGDVLIDVMADVADIEVLGKYGKIMVASSQQ